MIWSLNIPHSNQNPLFALAAGSVSISSKLAFRWLHHATKKNLRFIFVRFYHCHGKRTCVLFWWQIQSWWFVYRFQSLNLIQLSTWSLLIVIGKPEENACLGKVKYDWVSIVWQWANVKYFLSTRCNIWNSRVAFYNETICLLRWGSFNRDLSVVTPV